MYPKNVTDNFVGLLLEAESESMRAEDVDQVHKLFLDYCGVALAGSRRDVTQALRRVTESVTLDERFPLVGGGFANVAEFAAMSNGASAHSFELDDTHDASMSHPGSVVFSVALALASDLDVRGDDFTAAVIAGYECIARLGVAAQAHDVIIAGHHPTALFGVFGATVTAAKMMGMDREGLVNAFGHALSLSSGSMQFSDETVGTDVKRLHPGFAAHNGILSAKLSSVGISAPRYALEGRYGFFNLYSSRPNVECLFLTGESRQIHSVSVKPYSCCRLFHSTVDAIQIALNGRTPGGDDVARIVVRAPRVVSEQHMLKFPSSSMAAQYSLPFVVGATLCRGSADFGAYEPDQLNDARVGAFAKLVVAEVDEAFEAQYPSHFGSAVDIVMRNGDVLSASVLDSLGTPGNPMSRRDVVDKLGNLLPDSSPGEVILLDHTIGAFLKGRVSARDLLACLNAV